MEKAIYPPSHLYSWGRIHLHRDPRRGRPRSRSRRGIRSREDYLRYLEADRRALEQTRKRPRLFGDGVWRFERLLRAIEYHDACRRAWYHRPLRTWLYLRLHFASVRLGFTIPPHVFGPGLSIAHRGTIVVNSCARVGANCRLHACTNIGSWSGAARAAPVVGDNVYIGPGAVLYGPIAIADNIAIGANSVVNTSFTEPNITIAGAPARKVRDGGTTRFVARAGPGPSRRAGGRPPASPRRPGATAGASAPPACADSMGVRLTRPADNIARLNWSRPVISPHGDGSMTECPECGGPLAGDEETCPACGASIEGGAPADGPGAGPGGARTRRPCRPSSRRPTTATGPGKVCPKCGALNPADAQFCIQCRHGFAGRTPFLGAGWLVIPAVIAVVLIVAVVAAFSFGFVGAAPKATTTVTNTSALSGANGTAHDVLNQTRNATHSNATEVVGARNTTQRR